MSQDGLRAVLPSITRQILHPTASELLRMLRERFVVLPAGQRLQTKEVRAAATHTHWALSGSLPCM